MKYQEIQPWKALVGLNKLISRHLWTRVLQVLLREGPPRTWQTQHPELRAAPLTSCPLVTLTLTHANVFPETLILLWSRSQFWCTLQDRSQCIPTWPLATLCNTLPHYTECPQTSVHYCKMKPNLVPGHLLCAWHLITLLPVCWMNQRGFVAPEQGRTQPHSQAPTETTLHCWLPREWKASQEIWKELLKTTKL